MTLVMDKFHKVFVLIFTSFLILCCFFSNPKNTFADSEVNGNPNRQELKRSLESLRDFDYQTWQIIVYPISKVSNKLNLRIVGYPGSLRMNHPTDLVVKAGRKEWDLEDITKKSKEKFETLNDSVAEFDLTPLITELDKNRPLRMRLPGLINDLPIPPYLVSEWRTLVEKND
tara:strand:- start:475 stop:990 length:516 start_codon:yes stop_codon:yes gene_type:complete